MAFTFSKFSANIQDSDTDIRQMALYDLHTELGKESFVIDDATQRTVVDHVLRALDDSSSEVQGIAVKCLAPLVRKVKDKEVLKMVTALATSCVTPGKEKKEKRDIAGVAMKTVVAEIPTSGVESVKSLTQQLVAGLHKAEDRAEVLDVLNDIVNRFGSVIPEHHSKLQELLLHEIAAENSSARKKATLCLASLCVYSSPDLFNTVVEKIKQGIQSADPAVLQKYIQLCSAVSRTSGQRLDRHLETIVPMLVIIIKNGTFKEEDADDIHEHIIQAFESFVLRCPQQVTRFLKDIIAVCKDALKHDPNYTYEEEEEEAEPMEEDEELMEDDEEMDQDEEDDDVSWKVRKAGAKCLTAIVQSRPDMLDTLYSQLSSQECLLLPDQFKEREESVRLDVFGLFLALLNQTKAAPNAREDDLTSTADSIRVQARPEVAYLKVPAVRSFIVKRLMKSIKDKSMKVKIAAFNILKELTAILETGVAESVPSFIAAIKEALGDRNASSMLKTTVLGFLRYLVSTNPASFTSQLTATGPSSLTGLVFASVHDKYYKIIAEALRVCGEFVTVAVNSGNTAEADRLTKEIFNCVYARLSMSDIDQDVKESAIVTIGRLMSQGHSHLGKENLDKAHALLLKLLQNEMSRLTAIRILCVVKDVPTEPDVLNKNLDELAGFLKKNSRQLKQAALTALRDLTTAQRAGVQPALLGRIIDEVPPLLSDQDLHLTFLGLELLTAILEAGGPEVVSRIEKLPLDHVVKLLRSSLLQGHALSAARAFFELLAKRTKLGYNALLDKALSAAAEAGSKQAFISIAQVVASIASVGSENDRKTTLDRFLKQLGSPQESDVMLALYCIGEIGYRTNISSYGNVTGAVRQQFDSSSEEAKVAASLSLGRICAGNIGLLDTVVSEINSNEKHRYLLLRSLKETIVSAPHDQLQARIEQVLPLLFQYSQAEEEAVRNVVAECLGKLALVAPEKVMSQLASQMQPQSNQKACIITALKYTITEQPQPIDEYLRKHLPLFFKESLTKDENVKIRRAGVLLLTAAVHNKPNLVRSQLAEFMPALYAETFVDKSLIREISLGPFKHKVDDGLELRKAAFECLDIMLDHTSVEGSGSLLDYLNDHMAFIAHLQNGLASDNPDIKTLAHLMLSKLTRMQSATVALLATLTETSEKLKATVTAKLKQNTVRQEQERHDDVIKSALRAIEALSKVNGALDNQKFKELYTDIIQTDKDIKVLYERVLAERDAKEQ